MYPVFILNSSLLSLIHSCRNGFPVFPRMSFDPGFELLLSACRVSDSDAAVAGAVAVVGRRKPDWDDLLRRVSFHRLEPQLSALFESLPKGLVPETVLESLRDTVRSNLAGQIRYVAEFFRIREWLEKENITVIPYKGFRLGDSAYGNIGARSSSDIDLFIDLKDLDKVKEIMTKKGYSGHEGLDRLRDEHVRSEMAEYNFDRYEEGVCQAHVEFHWRSSMTFYRMDITLDDMRSQVITDSLQGRPVFAFSPVADLLLAVMHHGGKECYWQLRQVLDIAQILRNRPEIDYDWLLRQADRFHVTTLLLLGVRLANMLTGVEVPEALAGQTSDRLIGRLATGRVRLMAKTVDELTEYKERLSSWIFKIRSRDGFATKVHLFRYTLRKVIAPRLVPERWRHLFFNRTIRRRQDGN